MTARLVPLRRSAKIAGAVAALTLAACPAPAPEPALPVPTATPADTVASSPPRAPTPRAPSAPPDRDGDGIPDDVDQCPDEQESFNGTDDEDGCPDKGGPRPPEPGVRILRVVEFTHGSSSLSPEGRETLTKLVAGLQANPELVLVEAEGLAGPKEPSPIDLSRRRAQVVVEALVAQGVARGRLRAMGYGAHCPELTVRDSSVAASHRIVKFAVVKNAAGVGEEPTGCRAARAAGIAPPAAP